MHTCAKLSSCVIAKLAWIQFGAKLSSCVIAKLARMHICGTVSICVIAKLAWMQFGAELSSCVNCEVSMEADLCEHESMCKCHIGTGRELYWFVCCVTEIDTRYFRKRARITCRALYFVD